MVTYVLDTSRQASKSTLLETAENPSSKVKVEFKEGTQVEVSSDEEGFNGAWFSGKVVGVLADDKFLVEYEKLMADDNITFLREEVDILHIRPPPPDPQILSYKRLQEVDAMHNDGWWVGVVSKVLKGQRYIVYFKETNEEYEFAHSYVRPHQDWLNGEWVTSSSRIVMWSLDDDVTSDILSRLPVKTLMRFKSVSKPWRTLISSPSFAKIHFKRSAKVDKYPANFLIIGAPEYREVPNILEDGREVTSHPRHVHLFTRECNGFDDVVLEICYPLSHPSQNVKVLCDSCYGIFLIRVGSDKTCLWNPSTGEYKILPETTVEYPEGLGGYNTMVYGLGCEPLGEE
ncbi:hypothetical protein GIB67_024058 [Kingdonia uniflora]|uniref:F-box domain-containing protein n=1 Tax=Kingdonia uniflora TaxID=39325 RepID=A0A7J7LAU4_9MAGN|nr:hypothetical protein GIB67_024058 [Kingdonia uniflora]